jgi:hypothetical protein
MYKLIYIVLIFIFTVSCGTQRQLKKSYEGQPVAILKETFGAPKTIIEKEGEKIYIFEKKEELRSTEIKQGKFTLDPIITPKATKTEHFFFTVTEGVITGTRIEEEYER